MAQNPWESGGQIQPELFGAILRDTRLGLGRSLQDGEKQTRILARHLAALESGEFSRLPPGIYARGFVHNYAMWLQLNPQEMVRLFNEARGETEVYRPQPVARPVSTAGPFSPNFVVIIFVVGMLAVVTAWGYTLLVQTPPKPPIAFIDATTIPPTPTTISRTVSAAANSTPNPSAIKVQGASDSATPASTPAASATPQAGITVVLTASADAYIEVFVDGSTTALPQKFVKSGAPLTIEAKQSVRIFCGAPSNVTYSVNGQSKGALPAESFKGTFTVKPNG